MVPAGRAPAYLHGGLPSALEALARLSLERGVAAPSLHLVKSYGEMLRPSVRSWVRCAWNVDIADMYSAQEVGYMALQCPHHTHHHVQSEHVVLVGRFWTRGRAAGGARHAWPGRRDRACQFCHAADSLCRGRPYAFRAGTVSLRTRGLPVLERIQRRSRDLLTLPTGERLWPSFPERSAGTVSRPFVRSRWCKRPQTPSRYACGWTVPCGRLLPERRRALDRALAGCTG